MKQTPFLTRHNLSTFFKYAAALVLTSAFGVGAASAATVCPPQVKDFFVAEPYILNAVTIQAGAKEGDVLGCHYSHANGKTLGVYAGNNALLQMIWEGSKPWGHFTVTPDPTEPSSSWQEVDGKLLCTTEDGNACMFDIYPYGSTTPAHRTPNAQCNVNRILYNGHIQDKDIDFTDSFLMIRYNDFVNSGCRGTLPGF